jgi:hypothetical protein
MKVSTKNAANKGEKARADAEEICFSPAPAVRRARVGATDDISSFFTLSRLTLFGLVW